ncbi:kinase-like domain-containing protein [Penicillium angulare]|uniref:kinase-like domain-containing protein n=1 Tax=Penicillium angulare TaxID=116970 RepID=UPI0025402B68|nr:kinase-like domain-containing protein [Penicillium angulare]KAJ5288060.1 kinase-like domain-containing protein [Penicillium angulare]
MYLDETWTPTAQNLPDEYIIILPLLHAAFYSLYGSNVSYDPPDSMLTDFGCASDKAAIRFDGTGTRRYLAPEQQCGELHGKEVDYWSCAIIGLELIRGRIIESRIKPRDNGCLDLDNKDMANLTSPDVLSKCSRAMIQVEPDMRMTAAQGLKLLQSPQV